MFKSISQRPYYLFLFPIFFVLHGFVEYLGFVLPASALLLALLYIGVSLVLTFIFYFFYKDFAKAAVMTFCVMAFHLFFGNIYDLLVVIFKTGFILRYTFLIPVFLIMLIVLFFVIGKRDTVFTITFYLNILMTLLIILDAGKLVIQKSNSKNSLSYREKITRTGLTVCDTCSKPDVYIILLDEYAGAAELNDVFQYSNQPFFDSLSLRGFKTMTNVHSNYNYTPYSTCATLNMNYLDPEKTKNVKKGFKYAATHINDNRTIDFFLANGYQFYNYSPFTVAGQSSRIEGAFVPVNTELITAGTFVTRFKKDVLPNIADKFNMDWYLKKSTYTVNKDNELLYNLTKKVAETKTGPKLVYTHLLMPHHPYYYNEHGEMYPYDTLRKSSLENTGQYLSYLKYANKQVIALADHILSHSPTPPLIVFLSDHGYRHYTNNSDSRYNFSSLFTVHFADSSNSLPDSTSNVNFFRIVLNQAFRQSQPLLEDKLIFIDF